MHSDSVAYTVAEVIPGRHVILTSPDRLQPSVLPWSDIPKIHDAALTGVQLTPKAVDEILENPQNWNSGTMCALVLAMPDPTRVH